MLQFSFQVQAEPYLFRGSFQLIGQETDYLFIHYCNPPVRPNITSISSHQTTNETDDLELSCHATGTPTLSITWSRPGNKEWREANSPLLLKNISRYQDGEYVCTAMNDAGNATASVIVTVNCKYEIVAQSFKCLVI